MASGRVPKTNSTFIRLLYALETAICTGGGAAAKLTCRLKNAASVGSEGLPALAHLPELPGCFISAGRKSQGQTTIQLCQLLSSASHLRPPQNAGGGNLLDEQAGFFGQGVDLTGVTFPRQFNLLFQYGLQFIQESLRGFCSAGWGFVM